MSISTWPTGSPPPESCCETVDSQTTCESKFREVFYIGHDDFDRDTLIWIEDDSGHRLVKKSANIPAHERESSELAMIVTIPSYGFFLTSCALWTGPNRIVNALYKAKASCLGRAPADGELASEYRRAMMNIQYFVNSMRTPGVDTQRGLLMDSNSKIKFRHILFEPMYDMPDDEPMLSPEFCLENWPVDSMNVKPYLDELKVARTHHPIPLPAYDLRGDLIKPGQYRDVLRGATVLIHFTLVHYNIKNEVDGYAADITHIKVLTLTPPTPRTPPKRNLPQGSHIFFDANTH